MGNVCLQRGGVWWGFSWHVAMCGSGQWLGSENGLLLRLKAVGMKEEKVLPRITVDVLTVREEGGRRVNRRKCLSVGSECM